ncbi:MAG: glycoside hydrolase family 31 protein, partial [Bacteroidales bacterium]|nr:glycoside hydrolase family 31 protein [Bacteroidales bacterium]
RSHGSGSPREIYQFGDRGYWAFDVQEQYINLRYAMLPYLYSTAWQITKNGYSYMRQLSMEAPQDKKVYNMDDEYMFGSAFLVAPVLEADAKTRKVYLPNSSQWYDYWTNELYEGGQTVSKEVPIEIMPLYVKAGSIVPFNTEKVQYAEEKPWTKLELKVYPGADASFVLYEDENDNYNYEKGAYTEIPVTWDNVNNTLTIGARTGSFEGMLKNRKFVVSVVGQKAKTISYTGKELKVKF